MTEFSRKLTALDAFLTGKTGRDVEHTARNSSIKTPDDLLFGHGDRAYYLSDGGYSRIMATMDDTGTIFLTSNSRDEVKDRWRFCPELIAGVENELKGYLRILEQQENER